ncbi:MAG TPA: hypothetical protein ENN17_11410 [bacterium]|nr:hypothetical protein [bacterium]
MKEEDVCIATDWEYDRDFIKALTGSLFSRGLSMLVVRPENLADILGRVRRNELVFRFLFDRASDTSPEFIPLQKHLREKGTRIIDPIDRIRWASDKATLHLEFLTAGIPTPYTLILPPVHEADEITLSVSDLAHLGRPFVIKPANTTGGGTGVVDGAETLQDVLFARKEFRHDKYLLQERIIPDEREGRRFWFRAFYVFGKVVCTWWNEETHLYADMTDDEKEAFPISDLEEIVFQIASVSGLSFFSSEIARRRDGGWVVVDYVNESCDMRFQSRHRDGVPDAVIAQIIDILVHLFQGRSER